MGDVVIPVTVTDQFGASFVSTVTIHPVNPGPVTTSTARRRCRATPVTVDLLGNDSDPDGDAISISAARRSVPAAQGTIALVGGDWVFTPAPGFTGTATISYTIVDADGATANGTHTVDVAPNAPPAFTDPDLATGPFVDPGNPANLIVPASDGTAFTVDLDLYYADPNGNTMTLVVGPVGPAVVAELRSRDAHVLGHAAGRQHGADVVIPVTVTDQFGASFVSTVTIHPVNPGPVANTASTPAVQDNPVTVDLLGNDSDPDGDAISISAARRHRCRRHRAPSPSVGGNWVFTPAPGFTGTATISYTIVDADGATANGTHTVDVAPNAPPAFTDPDLATGPFVDPGNPANLIVPASDGTPLSVDLDLYYADPNGNTMTLVVDQSGLPAWLSYDAGDAHVLGHAAGRQHGDRRRHPRDRDRPVRRELRVDRHDPSGQSGTGRQHRQHASRAGQPRHRRSARQRQRSRRRRDRDPAATPPSVPAAQGTIALVGGNWVFTPAPGFTGTATISYTIVDADGATANGTHTVDVAPNAPPAFTDPDLATGPFVDPGNPANLIVPASDGTALSVDLDLYYADPNGNTMTLVVDQSGLPSWLSYDPGTHTFSGTPPVDNTGTDVVIPVTVTDQFGASFVSTVTIHPVNPGPVANTASTPAVQDNPVTVDLLGNDSDPDGDAISISAARHRCRRHRAPSPWSAATGCSRRLRASPARRRSATRSSMPTAPPPTERTRSIVAAERAAGVDRSGPRHGSVRRSRQSRQPDRARQRRHAARRRPRPVLCRSQRQHDDAGGRPDGPAGVAELRCRRRTRSRARRRSTTRGPTSSSP